MSAQLAPNQYLVRQKVLSVLGAKFHIFDHTGKVVLFSQQKAFKLKEDIRIYSDETKTDERLAIMARNVIDFSSAYDVIDSTSGAKVGALQRKGFASIVRDSWQVLDPDDGVIGKIEEDSMALALLRRFIGIIPQSFVLTQEGSAVPLVTFKQNFNPFVFKLIVTVHPAATGKVDTQLALAAAILLAAIEGRQK